MHITKEFKVGLLGVVSLTLLYFGFNFLKGIDFLSSTSNYYALYYKIDGLTISNPVIINGLTVGRVSDIEILQEQNNHILVELNIDDKIKLKKGTEAKLINLDFLGSKAIELLINDSTNIFLEDGDTLQSDIDMGITEFLKQNAGPVADDIGATISKINSILDGFKGNSEKINNTLSNLEQMSGKLNQNLPVTQAKLNTLFDNLNKNSTDLSELMKDLKPTMANAKQFSDSLKTLELNETLKKTQLTLDNLSATLSNIKEGKGTMGKLMTDDSLYIHLNNTARDLDKLLVDLKDHPGRYVQFSVFGKKDKSDKK